MPRVFARCGLAEKLFEQPAELQEVLDIYKSGTPELAELASQQKHKKRRSLY